MNPMPDESEIEGKTEMNMDSSAMPMPKFYKLHVVLHGMIGVRLSYQARTAQLHIPSIKMHEYHAGPFHHLKQLPYGHDYRLGGVRAGGWTPRLPELKTNHLVVSLAEHNLKCSPRATHATITLPWPERVGGVRILDAADAPEPLFLTPNGMNPRRLHYITYLTYLVEANARHHPTLQWNCCETFWLQEELHHHMRLHFFADPKQSLTVDQWSAHMPSAYDAFNDQALGGGLPMEPNLYNDPWVFKPCTQQESVIVPPNEAKDYYQVKHPDAPAIIGDEVTMTGAGQGGNCLAAMMLD